MATEQRPPLHRRFLEYARKESGALLFRYLFQTALAVFVTTLIAFFAQMPWYFLVLIFLSLFVMVVTGPTALREMSKGFRKPAVDEAELRRRREIYKLFNGFIAEAEKVAGWDKWQVDNWSSQVECAMRPLIPDEIQSFRQSFSDQSGGPDQARLRGVAWLKAACLKYWLSSAE